jgi:hypothetical protein
MAYVCNECKTDCHIVKQCNKEYAWGNTPPCVAYWKEKLQAHNSLSMQCPLHRKGRDCAFSGFDFGKCRNEPCSLWAQHT